MSDERNEEQNGKNSIGTVKKKQIHNLMILVLCLGTALSFIYFVITKGKGKAAGIEKEKIEFASPIKHVDAGSVLIERTETRLVAAEKATEALQKNIEELNKDKQKAEEEKPIEQKRVDALIKRIEDLEQKIVASQVSASNVPPTEAEGVLMTQGIRDDAVSLTPDDTSSIPTKNPKDYVPSGTFVKAVALGGADASAAVNAQSNPQPMLFRIVEDGTMPNNRKSHLKGCLATAAVVGDISSERGFIRLETLSCVDPETNRILDLNVEGTVFGPEGKSGIRGEPLWREGALLQRAFAAGALSGLAHAVGQKYTQTSISPLGTIQAMTSSDTKDILAHGAAGGLGKAMEKLADYNIRRAEQYHPVLQLSAGTVVDLVFLKGFFLNDPKSSEGMPNKIMKQGDTDSLDHNLSNMPKLTLTQEQETKLQKHVTELNK